MMNCDLFKNKILEYIHGTLSEDDDREMENHISSCESCRSLYEEELALEDAFTDVFSIDEIEFKSSKEAIMNSIDKNKYKNTINNKLHYSFKKHSKKYIGVAAALLIGIFMIPVVFKGNSKKSEIMTKSAAEEYSSFQENSTTEDSNIGNKESKDKSFKALENISLFNMNEVDLNKKLEFSTPWKATVDGQFEAAIEGRGIYGKEEGIGTIFVKDLVNSKMYEFKLADETAQQSPLYIEWYDNENLIVITGLGYGRLETGDRAVLLNIKNNSYIPMYEAQNPRERLISISPEGNNLRIKSIYYIDDILNKYEDKEKIIENYTPGDLITIE